jgi:lipid A disaccharide synthetase
MHFATVRWDEAADSTWNGPSPPQYGWPFPWTAWNGVSSLEWIIAPIPLVLDLAVYTAFVAAALFVGFRLAARGGEATERSLKNAMASLAIAALLVVLLSIRTHEVRSLQKLQVSSAQIWLGRMEPFP